MNASGIIPEDAPDPAIAAWESVRSFPLPITGMQAQPALELLSPPGMSSTGSGTTLTRREFSLSYTLWRFPGGRDEPRNLAELDEETERSLNVVPPWPRPGWLVAAAERLRYPVLWECVRTYWVADESDRLPPADLLRRHAAHILVNHFREQLGLGIPPHPWPEISEASLEHGIPVRVDGTDVKGVRPDTDPFVFGLAADLGAAGVFTAVFPRDELPFVDLAFRSYRADELAV